MATSGNRRLAAFALALALFAGARPAHAGNPSESDVATARELYRQGADALDMGSPKAAVEKLAQAWALVQTPVIGTDLARAHKALGHLVQAREAALAVQRIPVTHDETSRSTQARSDAERIAAELEGRVAHLKIVVAGVGDGYTPTVKLDGTVVGDAALPVPRQADPGEHLAILDTDDGRHAEARVTLGEGETKEITLTVGAPSGPPKPPKPSETVIIQQSPSLAPPPPSKLSAGVWIGIVTTGVGVLTGAFAGAFALSSASIVHASCTSTGADGKLYCPPSHTADLDAANTLGIVSTVGFVAAGVGATVLIVALVVSGGKHHDTRARVLPWISPLGGGVAGTF